MVRRERAAALVQFDDGMVRLLVGNMDASRHIVAVSGLISNPQGKSLPEPRSAAGVPAGRSRRTIEACSEIMEETGIAASIGALVGVYTTCAAQADVRFLGMESGEPRTSDESLEVVWRDACCRASPTRRSTTA
jgi:hypothetical protein